MVDLMMNEQQPGTVGTGVPAGFKLTEVGVIPEDWNCVPFGSLFKTSLKRKNVSDHELVSFIGMQDVSEDAQLKNSTQLHFKEIKNGFTYFEKGDVLLAKITPCFENGKGCYTSNLLTNIGFGSTEFHVLRENENSNSRFIYFWTTEKKFRSSLESEMVGSAGHRRVPLNALKTYLIPCPKSKMEQSVIADTLSDVDNFIMATEKLVAKKQAIKTAAMQQLLTGKTRLPQFASREDGTVKGYKKSELGEIPEDWKTTTFGSVVEKIIGGGTPSRSNSSFWGNEIPWVTVKDLSTFDPSITQEYITKRGLDNSSSNLIPKGTLITSTRMALGKAVIYDIDVAINQDIKAIFPTRYLNNHFLYFWFEYNSKNIEELGSGSTVKGLSLSDLRGITFLQPLIEEQTAIAAILSDMDKEIQILQQRLKKIRQLKQGMMQELLTGKTRLI
ncbi:restriction endonuclease subunit S [Dickeya dianthicola]|uniref:Restriction endonuclease subunit S n=1 Tax=Dickeya dianthicola TaxID=204039 RepID=A0AAX1C9J0_9GAMM|nr:restriction endonuclease subunit S [Dickeya dianthicola]